MEVSQHQEGTTSKIHGKQDTEERTLELSFTQMEGRYYCCGKSGHRGKPRSAWVIHQTPN
jgi:hypothetical protein